MYEEITAYLNLFVEAMADDVHEPPGVISDGQSFDEDQDLGHADYLQGLQYITDATKHDTIKEVCCIRRKVDR